MKSKLPKEIFVAIEGEHDDKYLNAQRTIRDIADTETKTVGRYVLADLRMVALQPVEGRITKPT